MDTPVTRHENAHLRLGLAAVALLTVAVLGVVLVVAAVSARSDAAAAASEPALGSPAYLAPYGHGWGAPHPHWVDNGGDPTGSASTLRWQGWGEPTATARGKTPLLRPGGGYYRRLGKLKFRADRLGTCPDGTYGYTRLHYRVAHRPDGPLGHRWRGWGSPSGDICTTGG
jgi:hypothetical protein